MTHTHVNAPPCGARGPAREREPPRGRGLLLLNLRSGSTGRGGVTGVILGGSASGGILMGDADTDVDDFARAVAIRLTPPSADSTRPPGVLHL